MCVHVRSQVTPRRAAGRAVHFHAVGRPTRYVWVEFVWRAHVAWSHVTATPNRLPQSGQGGCSDASGTLNDAMRPCASTNSSGARARRTYPSLVALKKVGWIMVVRVGRRVKPAREGRGGTRVNTARGSSPPALRLPHLSIGTLKRMRGRAQSLRELKNQGKRSMGRHQESTAANGARRPRCTATSQQCTASLAPSHTPTDLTSVRRSGQRAWRCK